MNIVADALTAFRIHRKAFIVMNLVFYGLFAAVMITTMALPGLKETARAAYDINNVDPALLRFVGESYASGDLLRAAAATFAVNVTVAALTVIPSLIVPFIGIPYVYYRGLLWGAMFAPFGMERIIAAPHLPTVIIEGFAYVLAAFAAYVQGVGVLRPERYGFSSRNEAYRRGLPTLASLSIVVIVILIGAALYEAYEVIHLVPGFVARAAAAA